MDRGVCGQGVWTGVRTRGVDGGCTLPPETATDAVGAFPTGMHSCII